MGAGLSTAWKVALSIGAAVGLAAAGFWVTRAAAVRPDEAVAVDALRARATPPPAAEAPGVRFVLVYVSGAVQHPGLYRLAADLRVVDAIAAAGGLRAEADPSRMPNLAGRLSDGKEVKVPRRGSGSSASTRLDVNTATYEELAAVPGMDPALARAIVDTRERYGPFISLTDMRSSLDIDAAWLDVLRPYLTVGP